MKKIIKTLAFTLLTGVVLFSCKKDENKDYFEGGTPPVLTSTYTAPMVLLQSNKLLPGATFSWTNPNYNFTTGLSSQDVFYTLQVDTVGANFSSPGLKEQTIPQNLAISYNVGEFNQLFSYWLENVPHDFEIRIKATLNGNAPSAIYSNVIPMTITPYLDVAVPLPANGELWLTGDAVSSGYSNPLPSPYVTTQKFTKISSILYELTLTMLGGGGYKLLQDNGNWSTQYHMIAGGTWSSGSFEKLDSDPAFPGPPVAGTYKISVNFKTGKYTVTQ